MIKIGITGSKGFIGTNLSIELWTELHADIFEYDLPKFDITNEGIEFDNIDYLYHLAAYTKVHKSFEESDICHSVNVQGTQNVVNAARRSKVKRIIFASSILVYKNTTKTSLKDELGYNNIGGPYGESKIEGEKIIMDSKIPYTILRISSPYGARMRKGPYFDIINHQVYFHPNSVINFVLIEKVMNEMMISLYDEENSIRNVFGENIKLLDLYEKYHYPLVKMIGRE